MHNYKLLWNAIDKVLAHFGPDEKRDFDSISDSKLKKRHIYRALLALKNARTKSLTESGQKSEETK